MMKHFNWMRRAGRSVLAVALSLAMSIPSASFAAADDTAKQLYYGDVNMDGSVEATDALAVLQAVVKLSDITDETARILADMDGDGALSATDALAILQTVVKIKDAIPYTPAATAEPITKPTEETTPTPTTAATPKPTATPMPTITPVPAYTENAVTGTPVEITDNLSSGVVYDAETGIYTFLDATSGIDAVNPFSGVESLVEDPVELLEQTTAAPDHDLVWDLAGASMVATEFPKEIDPRAVWYYAPEAGATSSDGQYGPAEKGVTYTIPEWTQGVSFSFWAKSQDEDGNDTAPIISLVNGTFCFTLRLNGSTYFHDNTSTKNKLVLNNSKASAYNEWEYYTVTIKNDWITVYVNGQESLYTSLKISRADMGDFNDGFLTRYNAIGNISEEMLEEDVRGYYRLSGAYRWYEEDGVAEWNTDDDYTVFGNARFRGNSAGAGQLLMNCLTDEDTLLYIGGLEAEADFGTEIKHNMAYGTQFADMEYYSVELTPEQVAANYLLATKPADIGIPTAAPPTPTPEPTPTPTPRPSVDVNEAVEGVAVSLIDSKETTAPGYGPTSDINSNKSGTFSMDSTTGIITFNEKQLYSKTYRGAIFVNKAKGRTDLEETMEQALEGQYLMPDTDGTTTVTGSDGNEYVMSANEANAIQSVWGNFYDVWYGELYNYTNITEGYMYKYGAKIDINTLEVTPADTSSETSYAYARPVWSNGISYSFWYKPTADEDKTDAILTLYKDSKYVCYMDIEGSVFFLSLEATDYKGNSGLKATNVTPYYVFCATGNDQYLDMNGWNYYTITFANDMIQTYINGEEVVYNKLNLNRQSLKFFNGGFLTRYNTIGLCIEGYNYSEEDDYNLYLKKSGYVQSTRNTTTNEQEANHDVSDNLSIRVNNPYKELNANLKTNNFHTLLIDFLVDNGGKVVIGGYPTTLNAEFVKHEEQATDDNGNPLVDENGDPVMQYVGFGISGFGDKAWCTDHNIPAGAQAYDLTFYDCELEPTQVRANYVKALTDDAEVLGLTTE